MQTITVQIKSREAMKALRVLEAKHFISILNNAVHDSPALPGKTLSMMDFRNWITDAETAPAISFDEAKARWAEKRKQLRNLIK